VVVTALATAVVVLARVVIAEAARAALMVVAVT